MIIARLHSGIRITDLASDGQLFTRLYVFYTKREAIAEFRRELREYEANIIREVPA